MAEQRSGAGATPAPPPTPAPPSPSAPATSAPALPRLETVKAEFDMEQEDKDWAANTERAIKAVAPALSDVECKQRSCRATLNAADEQAMMLEAEKLSEESSLKGTEGAKSVLLTKPESVGGKLKMQIFVRYDR